MRRDGIIFLLVIILLILITWISELDIDIVKPRANGRNIVGCYMLQPFAHPVACCCVLLGFACAEYEAIKLLSQQLPTSLLFSDRRSIARQCWIRLHSSSNIVRVTHAHYSWCTKTYGLYPSHDALQVPTLFGVVVSACTPLPTRMQQLLTLLAQQCWELLRSFARTLRRTLMLVTFGT